MEELFCFQQCGALLLSTTPEGEKMQRFKLKTDIIFGQNALEALRTLHAKSCVVFTDTFLTGNGTADRIAGP